jgi:hypothetical protein
VIGLIELRARRLVFLFPARFLRFHASTVEQGRPRRVGLIGPIGKAAATKENEMKKATTLLVGAAALTAIALAPTAASARHGWGWGGWGGPGVGVYVGPRYGYGYGGRYPYYGQYSYGYGPSWGYGRHWHRWRG